MEKNKRATDLTAVKEAAFALLDLAIDASSRFAPIIVSHPFFSSNMCYIQKEERLIDLLESEEMLEKGKTQFRELIGDACSAERIMMLVNPPYRGVFFTMIGPYLDEKDFGALLRDSWTSAEFPSQDKNVTIADFRKLFLRADKEHLMSKSERNCFEKMPQKITIYRGINNKAYCDQKALSWTTSKDVAEFFSHRFEVDEAGMILTAAIDKKDVLAYFESENEVIVDYTKLKRSV